jgi:hypothetical protein
MLDRIRSLSPEQWTEMRARMAQGPAGPGGPGRGAALVPILDRARAMTPEQFAASRAALAAQIQAQLAQGPQRDPAEQLDWFIDRYLLQPAAPGLLRRRAGQG